MRYRLRTLLILVFVGPPVLAGGWFVGAPLVAEYFANRQRNDEWADVGGPGSIKEFEGIICTFEVIDPTDVDSSDEQPSNVGSSLPPPVGK